MAVFPRDHRGPGHSLHTISENRFPRQGQSAVKIPIVCHALPLHRSGIIKPVVRLMYLMVLGPFDLIEFVDVVVVRRFVGVTVFFVLS